MFEKHLAQLLDYVDIWQIFVDSVNTNYICWILLIVTERENITFLLGIDIYIVFTLVSRKSELEYKVSKYLSVADILVYLSSLHFQSNIDASCITCFILVECCVS